MPSSCRPTTGNMAVERVQSTWSATASRGATEARLLKKVWGVRAEPGHLGKPGYPLKQTTTVLVPRVLLL